MGEQKMSLFRAKATIENVLESNGKMSISKAMLKAGYPSSTAKNPQQLTRSKMWKQLLEEYLSDEYLSKKHKELLEKKDANAVAKGLDMAYKLKGRYQKDKENEEENKKTLSQLETENKELKDAIEKRKLQAQPRH